jgi:DNA-binding GntR family transcriptional regulator
VQAFESLQPLRIETAPERIADQLRASILGGGLAPGTQLTEVQLAERLGVSRGPVREAMQRLIQEGLLRGERHRGVFVMELGADDEADIFVARRAIEREAARQALARDRAGLAAGLARVVEEMQAAQEASDRQAVVEADLRFHELLVDAAGSKRLSRMFRTLIAETRLSMAMGLSHPAWRDPAAEHRRLARAFGRGPAERALERLDDHLGPMGTEAS